MTPAIPSDAAVRERAARRFDRNIVVTAGAGTGKTSLLTERVLHAVLEHDIAIGRLAAITFTDKAAAEMAERVEEAFEDVIDALVLEHTASPASEAGRVLGRLEDRDRAVLLDRARGALDGIESAGITTIHGFCADLLRRHAQRAGIDPAFEVDDGVLAATLFEELWPEHLARVFGEGGDPAERAAWGRLLERGGLDRIEQAARKLAAFEWRRALRNAPGEKERQLECWMHLARSVLARLRSLGEQTEALYKPNAKFIAVSESIEGIWSAILARDTMRADGRLPAVIVEAIERLPGSSFVGKKASEDAPELAARAQEIFNAALELTQRLPAADATLAGDVVDALGPFALRCQDELLSRGGLSFDAMIVLTRDLLREDAAVRRAEADRIDHLLIDEFQDNDPSQYEIAFLLTALAAEGDAATADPFTLPLRPGALFIVGDPKQSIYRFRGADIRAYDRAVQAIRGGGGEVLELRVNFRSVPDLVEPINRLFAGVFSPQDALDPPYLDLEAMRPAAGEARVEIHATGSATDSAEARRQAEARSIGAWILDAVADGSLRFRDCAVLLRAHGSAEACFSALRRLGIPYVAKGRGFYKRNEVTTFLCLLRAVTTTSDPMALLGWLRSTAAGVPDVELSRYAARAAPEPPVWSLRAQADARREPALAAALDLLRAFHARHAGKTIDAIARAALEETPALLVAAASYEGAQRAANLEKVVRRIGELAAAGRMTPEEILDHIELFESGRREEADSPLADETFDAVSVLTIHASKGLEWPVVIVADLARDERSSSRRAVDIDTVAVPTASGAMEALALRVGDHRTPARIASEEDTKLQEIAEAKRLLYVALTRARERLIVCVGESASRPVAWVRALRAWGFDPADAASASGMLSNGAVRLVRRDVAERRPLARESDDGEALIAALDTFRAARERAAAMTGAVPQPPSFAGAAAWAAAGAPAAPQDASAAASRAVAQAAGSTVHLLLEVWDRADPRWLLDNVERAARVAVATAGLDADAAAAVAARAAAILERARRDGALAGEAAAVAPLARELPLIYRDGEGRIWQGSIDAVAGSPAAPVIIDYKTAPAASTDAELEERYRPQLDIYRAGLARALGVEPPPARLVPLRTQQGPAGDD